MALAKAESQNTPINTESLNRLKELFPKEWQELEDAKPVNKELKKFITTYPELNRVKDDVKKLSVVDDPVLIVGPTGTGKEILARALHGDRKPERGTIKSNFVAINCAGLPEHLIESELFGHTKGAFTGATNDKVGLLQTAWGGTVFLDEVGELPMSAQAKLLRAIQEKEIRRVGDSEVAQINCRFVCATHREIKDAMIPAGLFREDLYYRIACHVLRTKPLSERVGDIEPLLTEIIRLDKGKINYPIQNISEFAEGLKNVRGKLTGNVRQLQNIVRSYHVLGRFEIV